MTKITIEGMITVGALAEKLTLPPTRLIGELMKNGVMVTINEHIDFDTAQIIVGELGLDVELVKKDETAPEQSARHRGTASAKALSRPPVIAVMGHVDHGKTTLLDAVRGTTVAKSEAGGITQYISAYQIMHNGRSLTLLDTPGHEAFSAIREHGARLTDIAVIVVAADDGVKPQTVEAIRFARKAGVKMVVALNKVDKPGADVNRVKQQLTEEGLLPEEWGGDTVIVEVSAKTKQGIDGLLDMLLLIADVEELKADFDGDAKGLIIESHLEQGKGPVANALVEEGTLKIGSFIVTGDTYAKVRTLHSTEGLVLNQATPSMPVTIMGFKALPEFGDEFTVVKDEKTARLQAEKAGVSRRRDSNDGRATMSSTELIKMINRTEKIQELNIIIRADVQGSLTSVVDSLKSLNTEEVVVRIVGAGVGSVTENDLHLAATGQAIIYGFNVVASPSIKKLADRDKVSIRFYNVIYELIDNVKEELGRLLSPEIIETELGVLTVKAIFKTTKSDIICGGEVAKGKLALSSLGRIMRAGKLFAEVQIVNLKRGPQDVKKVHEGEMCGVSLKTSTKLDLQEGDSIECFMRVVTARTL